MAARVVLQRIADIPEMPVDVALLDLEIGNRALQLAVPVDQALVLVDEPFAVELDEHFPDRRGQAFVHGEAVARPVRRGAEAVQLLADHAAGLRLPFPDLAQELLAAEIVARLRFDLAFDHHLGRDARMVRARLPQHRLAEHAMKADQRVLDGEGERMAHMQAAGDVRRRHHDAVGDPVRIRIGLEMPVFFPEPVVPRLHLGRLICLVQHR